MPIRAKTQLEENFFFADCEESHILEIRCEATTFDEVQNLNYTDFEISLYPGRGRDKINLSGILRAAGVFETLVDLINWEHKFATKLNAQP